MQEPIRLALIPKHMKRSRLWSLKLRNAVLSFAGDSSRPRPPPTEIDYNPLQSVSPAWHQCGTCNHEAT
eukprot:1949305-Prorocentrum_lima.AAC.1